MTVQRVTMLRICLCKAHSFHCTWAKCLFLQGVFRRGHQFPCSWSGTGAYIHPVHLGFFHLWVPNQILKLWHQLWGGKPALPLKTVIPLEKTDRRITRANKFLHHIKVERSQWGGLGSDQDRLQHTSTWRFCRAQPTTRTPFVRLWTRCKTIFFSWPESTSGFTRKKQNRKCKSGTINEQKL